VGEELWQIDEAQGCLLLDRVIWARLATLLTIVCLLFFKKKKH
jgi:hypothetical protein